MLLQPLDGEGLSVGREVILFLAHWELCLGISTPAHCGEVLEWLLHFAVENIDVVAKDDIHLRVRKQW